MTIQKPVNKQAVNHSSFNRDTDADGLPDRIDSQYSYPPVEQAKRTREMQTAYQANVRKHKR